MRFAVNYFSAGKEMILRTVAGFAIGAGIGLVISLVGKSAEGG